MKIAVVVLLVVHGLLHLLGFTKAWGFAALPQLSGKALIPLSESMTRGLGLAWLSVAMVFVVAAALCAGRVPDWWKVATVGVLVSQVLIVLQWPDAKAGTLANLLIAVAVVAAARRE